MGFNSGFKGLISCETWVITVHFKNTYLAACFSKHQFVRYYAHLFLSYSIKPCAAAVTGLSNGEDDYHIDECKGSKWKRQQRSSNKVSDGPPEARTEYAPNTSPKIWLSKYRQWMT